MSHIPSRQIIFHFHLFKNAGTSIDVNLRRIFGDDFLEIELGGPAELFQADELIPTLEERPNVSAVSSHTTTLPVPSRDGWQFLPIIFLRHPLDRILSMYTYERDQHSDSPGSQLAKKFDFPEYVAARLSSPHDVMLHNWQTKWMARNRFHKDHYLLDDEVLFDAASMVIEDLPFIGVVEHFSDSLYVLNHVLESHSIPANLRMENKNRSLISNKSLYEKLAMIKKMIGYELYMELVHANAFDMRLHRLAVKAIAGRLAQCQRQ